MTILSAPSRVPGRTAELTLLQAVQAALREEMATNPDLVLLGEDIGRMGGVFRATDGLLDAFGSHRVIDTPLNECGIVGAAIGMAMTGIRPCVEIQFADFIFPAFDQIVSELAKVRYRSGGQFEAPVTIRTPYGAGVRGGVYHSQSPEAYFVHTAGLKVVAPSHPAAAYGLLRAALRDPDPVIFLEPKRLYRMVRETVDLDDAPWELGRASRRRSGDAVSLFAYGAMVPMALEAAEAVAGEGIETDVIDIQTLWPLDEEMVLSSVRRTGRAVIIHEAPRTCGYGSELAAIFAEKAIDYLRSPVLRVTGADTPVPYALELEYLPSPARICRAIRRAVEY